MPLQRPFDPVVTFVNSQGEAARGTLTSLQRKAAVLEIYSPNACLQVSEVLSDFTVRAAERTLYQGKAIVVGLLSTGLMTVASLALIGEWNDLEFAQGDPAQIGKETERFIADWENRFRIRPNYQAIVNEFRAFLTEAARWVDQLDLNSALPRGPNGRLTDGVFWAIAGPLMAKTQAYLAKLEAEAQQIPAEDDVLHRAYAQSVLHPLILSAPFVYRTFAKPLGYAGDYEMVNQLLSDPRQGSSTYLELVNSVFLQSAVAQAHRNRIDILVAYLGRAIALAASEHRRVKVLNVGCGPAAEIQRLISSELCLDHIEFTLLDFSQETLEYTRNKLQEAAAAQHKTLHVRYVQASVHELIKHSAATPAIAADDFDFIYCAGLFDYLSDKVCARLIRYFVSKAHPGTQLLLTNVHSRNPARFGMEHLLEWHLIYRNEAQMAGVMAQVDGDLKLYTDETGVNVFAETTLRSTSTQEGHRA